jgi:hypothetical protein
MITVGPVLRRPFIAKDSDNVKDALWPDGILVWFVA